MPVLGPTCNTRNPVLFSLDKHQSQADIGCTVTVWKVPLVPGTPLTTQVHQGQFSNSAQADHSVVLNPGKYWVQMDMALADIGLGKLFEYSIACNMQGVFVEQGVLPGTVDGREGLFRLNVEA